MAVMQNCLGSVLPMVGTMIHLDGFLGPLGTRIALASHRHFGSRQMVMSVWLHPLQQQEGSNSPGLIFIPGCYLAKEKKSWAFSWACLSSQVEKWQGLYNQIICSQAEYATLFSVLCYLMAYLSTLWLISVFPRIAFLKWWLETH